MEYLIRDTKALLTEREYRAMFPTVSLPAEITEEVAQRYHATKVIQTPRPIITDLQYLESDVEEDPETGRYRVVWTIKDITDPDKVAEIEKRHRDSIKYGYESILRGMLDKAAQSKNYDNAMSAVIRAAYPGPYQQEGIKFGIWMDRCWIKHYELLGETIEQKREKLSEEEYRAQMPDLDWDEVSP